MASRLRIFETISLSCGGCHKTFLNPSDGSERIEIGSDGSTHLLYWHWLKSHFKGVMISTKLFVILQQKVCFYERITFLNFVEKLEH